MSRLEPLPVNPELIKTILHVNDKAQADREYSDGLAGSDLLPGVRRVGDALVDVNLLQDVGEVRSATSQTKQFMSVTD